MKKGATFADKIIDFNRQLSFDLPLPPGFAVLNPFLEGAHVTDLMETFYRKFYQDHRERKFVIGINPGRHGAGTTGIPFTDTKRLGTICGITTDMKSTHEVSSLFVYDMIGAYGGVESFYHHVYIHSLFPLALIRLNEKGTWVNCNYYDDKQLAARLEGYMIAQLRKQVAFGVDRQTAYVLGKKNAVYFEKINRKEQFFKQIKVLPHPRYIQQYKSKEKPAYIQEYLEALRPNGH